MAKEKVSIDTKWVQTWDYDNIKNIVEGIINPRIVSLAREHHGSIPKIVFAYGEYKLMYDISRDPRWVIYDDLDIPMTNLDDLGVFLEFDSLNEAVMFKMKSF